MSENLLLGNGKPVVGSMSVTALPLDWQAADSRLLKSPFSAAELEQRICYPAGFADCVSPGIRRRKIACF